MVNGGAGNDTLNGDAGADVITGGLDNDSANGGDGNDTFVATLGDGDDSYVGGAGTDTYDLSATAAAATVTDDVARQASPPVPTPWPRSKTSSAARATTLITFDAGANRIDGQDGNDTINAGAGADRLIGGLGDDIMNGGARQRHLRVRARASATTRSRRVSTPMRPAGRTGSTSRRSGSLPTHSPPM